MYSKFLIFKLLNVSYKDALSIHKRLLCSAFNKRNKELHDVSKELSESETFLSKQLCTIDFYILNKSITSHKKKLLRKLLKISTQLSTQTRSYQKKKSYQDRRKTTAYLHSHSNETITNLTQYELSQKEFDLLKAGLFFSIQPDKIRKSETISFFEKIHHSVINKRKSKETKNMIKVYIAYLPNSHFYNYKSFSWILGLHLVLRNFRKNQDKETICNDNITKL